MLNIKRFSPFFFLGECWSGSQSEVTYGKLGISTNCVDKCFEPCKPFKAFCAGENFANAVYRLSGELVAFDFISFPASLMSELCFWFYDS